MAAVAFAVEGDGVGFATESYAASAFYTTLASLSGALWRIRWVNLAGVPSIPIQCLIRLCKGHEALWPLCHEGYVYELHHGDHVAPAIRLKIVVHDLADCFPISGRINRLSVNHGNWTEKEQCSDCYSSRRNNKSRHELPLLVIAD